MSDPKMLAPADAIDLLTAKLSGASSVSDFRELTLATDGIERDEGLRIFRLREQGATAEADEAKQKLRAASERFSTVLAFSTDDKTAEEFAEIIRSSTSADRRLFARVDKKLN